MVTETRQFNRHEVMDLETLKAIGNIINYLVTADANFSLINKFYGLYDGFDYSDDILNHPFIVNELKDTNESIYHQVINICGKVSQYPTGVTEH